MAEVAIRPLAEVDVGWAEAVLDTTLGGRLQARRGELVDVLGLPGFGAVVDGEPGGVLTYQVLGADCELLAIAAATRHRGVGSALLSALREHATRAHCDRIWLITTNDNLDALRFYQRRGFHLRALYPGAVTSARRLKPRIPSTGAYGIPLRDELELELPLHQ